MANPVNELENLEAEFRDRMNNYVFDVLEKWSELQDYNFAIVVQQKDPNQKIPNQTTFNTLSAGNVVNDKTSSLFRNLATILCRMYDEETPPEVSVKVEKLIDVAASLLTEPYDPKDFEWRLDKPLVEYELTQKGAK